jgi:uncharacterized protein (UPF0335 family)
MNAEQNQAQPGTNEPTEMVVEGDMAAMMKKIKELEDEKAKLAANLTQTTGRIEQLSEKTKKKMAETLATTIADMVKNLNGVGEEKKKEFMDGMERIVNHTAEDSGVWQVMCTASEVHKQNVVELETARKENEALKQRLQGGNFAAPQARMEVDNGKKRKVDEIITSDSSALPKPTQFSWDAFTELLAKDHKSNGYTAMP